MAVYLRILRLPRLGPLLLTTLVARLPIGVNGLAIVLFLRAETGSFAVAGLVAGALALGSGGGAPLQGRIIDRFGRRTLVPLAFGHATGLVALLALGASASAAVLAMIALLTGIILPPVSSVLRAQYPSLVAGDPGLLRSLFALDSVLTETIFIVGPALTALLVATVAPGAALVLSAAAIVTGTLAFVLALPRGAGPARARRAEAGLLGALHSPGIRTLVLATAPIGFALGTVEVALPAFTTGEGRPELAGLLLALWSAGSLAGGLAYGANGRSGSIDRLHLGLALLLPLGFLPLVLAPSMVVMAFLLVPAGATIAPLIATRNELAGAAAPPGAETEAYTWPLTALVSGIALGVAAGGLLIDAASWRAAVAAGVLAAALGAVLALKNRASLGLQSPSPRLGADDLGSRAGHSAPLRS